MWKQRSRDASLDRICRELLRLHKALLDDERVAYERVHGVLTERLAALEQQQEVAHSTEID